jgi:hypothetical protein
MINVCVARPPRVAPTEEGIFPVIGVMDIPELVLHLLDSEQRRFAAAGVA